MLVPMALLAFVQDPFPWEAAANKAADQARREGKLVMLYFTSAGCGWSRKLEREVFVEAGVKGTLEKGFVGSRVDVDALPEITARFKVHGTPHLVAATADLKFVSQMIGFRDAAKLKAWIDRLQELQAKALETEAKLMATPADAALHRQLGDHRRDLGDLSSAIAAYEASANLGREKPNPSEEGRRFRCETLVRLTDALRTENNAGPLASLGEELCTLDADGKLGYRDNGLYVLALFEHHSGLEEGKPERSKRALEYLREAAAKFPDSDKGDEILLWLAVLCNDLEKNSVEAEKSLTRLIEKYPESPLAEFAKKALDKIRGTGAKEPAPEDPAKAEARGVVQDKYDRWQKRKKEVEAKGAAATSMDKTFVSVFEKDYLRAKEEFDAKWGERFEPK